MINSNIDALGVIFSNSYDAMVPELVSERLMASIPFASRYRIIDFMLSSMVNSGIDNVSLMVRKNYHSLMDHLGSGREWDLTRKNGGLNIVPPFAQKAINVYHGRVEAMANIMGFLKAQKEKYVIMTDSNIVVNFDFNEMIKFHEANHADVTIAYTRGPLPQSFLELKVSAKDLYYTFGLDGTRVKEIQLNSKEDGEKSVHEYLSVGARASDRPDRRCFRQRLSLF
jgi:glucose-1-phosphate adenylyltransferase